MVWLPLFILLLGLPHARGGYSDGFILLLALPHARGG